MQPWVLGCVINLCGSVVINVGTNLIKYHHTQQSSHAASVHTPFFSSRLPPATPSPPTGSRTVDPNVKTGSKQHHQVMPAQPLSPHSPVSCPQSPSSPPSPRSAPGSPLQSIHVNNSSPSSVSSSVSPFTTSLSSSARPPPPRSLYWYLGFFLFFVGNVSNFISMGFTAQSLLAGLGSIQFITNVLCSAVILKHPVTSRVLYATFAIVVGNVLIVTYASHHSEQLTVDQLWDLYTDNAAYQVYCAVLVVLVLCLYVYYKEMKKRLRAQHRHAQPGTLAYKLLPFSYAAISAIIGTQSVLLAKSSSELVRTTLGGPNQFVFPFTYFILTAWITSMVFWLYRMNAALRKFDGVFIIPVLQVVWTLFSIIGGGIYFREFSSFGALDIGLFTLGVCIVMFGVYLLAPQTHHTPVKTAAQQALETAADTEEEQLAGEERVMHIHSSGQHGTEMTSLPQHVLHSAGSLQPYAIRQMLAATNARHHAGHKYSVVPTHSGDGGSDASPTTTERVRSFSFSSSSSSDSTSSSPTDKSSTTSSLSPDRQSRDDSTPEHSPVHDVDIVLHSAHHVSRIHLVPDGEVSMGDAGALLSAAAGAAEGSAVPVLETVSGYGGVSAGNLSAEEGEPTPKRGRARGMSLGFSMPVLDAFDMSDG